MRTCPQSTARRYWPLYAVIAAQLAVTACTPTVKVAADEPITINLNVNIQHEVRVKVEDDLEDLLSDDSGLF
ncbi:MAG: YnbE family lipoprotein [Pseudomonadota bacterium]